jgi:UDP-GlcNAc:undecaprenyl-phosphate GlcNAc-1-phosphate transferase
VPILVAFGLAAGLTPIARAVGLRLGFVDAPHSDLKIHRHPIPILGGAAVMLATAGSVVAAEGDVAWGLAAGVLFGFIGGLVDDSLPLPALMRILILAAAGALVGLGSDLGSIGVIAGVIGLVLLVVACSNAVNILDGQDGLAGGLAAIAALGLAGIAARAGDSEAVVLGLATAGALMGFLLWNWPRARIFLGNGGAYGVGIVLAYLAARVTVAEGWRGFLAAGACLGVFAFEVLFTTTRRALSGGSITAGDRLHSYDVLARSLGRQGSTLAFWTLGVLAAVMGLLVLALPPAGGAAVVTAGAIVGVAAGLRIWGGLTRGRPHSPRHQRS